MNDRVRVENQNMESNVIWNGFERLIFMVESPMYIQIDSVISIGKMNWNERLEIESGSWDRKFDNQLLRL